MQLGSEGIRKEVARTIGSDALSQERIAGDFPGQLTGRLR